MPRTPWKSHQPEARIAAIQPGSIAEELELQPGDLLLAVNGAPLTDYIAYRFAIAEEEITLQIARGEECGEVEIEKDADEDLGIIFTSDVFDGVRACRNQCIFCFEEQMPAGMRASLRLRDDDFRLSFLHGNFLTLTNLTDADFARIARERLSPLFVSIHTTDIDVRRRMLRNRRAPDLVAQLRRLGDAEIEVHGQIVLCPGWNDGETLERTLAELAGLIPPLRSVGIVPVGLTAHRAESNVRGVTADDAARLLAQVEHWQAVLLPRVGTRLVFAADEFYLLAGQTVPPTAAYEGFLQRENGIGLVRLFLDDMAALPTTALPGGEMITLATGTLAAPLLHGLAEHLTAAGQPAQVIAVPNGYYGGGVSVAGLLTGSDLLAALAGRALGRLVILPTACRNADGVFLDDLTPADLERALGVPLHFCAGPEEVMAILDT